MDIFEWLAEKGDESKLRPNKEGVLYFPIYECETQLDMMQVLGVNWGTQNFKCEYLNIPDDRKTFDILVSASIELVLAGKLNKTLVGTATFKADDYAPNIHLYSIAKSLATVNAASDLGNKFFRYLYAANANMPEQRAKQKMDVVTRRKWEIAHQNFDTKMIAEIDTNYVVD